jgi:hypothetical protein
MGAAPFWSAELMGNPAIVEWSRISHQQRCTRRKRVLLIVRRTTMAQQNTPNQPQQGNKPGQPNPMQNKPGQGSQQSSSGQQSTNKK